MYTSRQLTPLPFGLLALLSHLLAEDSADVGVMYASPNPHKNSTTYGSHVAMSLECLRRNTISLLLAAFMLDFSHLLLLKHRTKLAP